MSPREDDAPWLARLRAWLADAEASGMPEPNAMVLATASPDGRPSARTVLLKEVDATGLRFHTDVRSRKGREALANPHAALVFPWFALGRQVVVTGEVVPVPDAETDRYFAGRPRGRQLGAHASVQGSVLASRAVLEERLAEVAARFGEEGPVPRPDHWRGLRVVPDAVEFWVSGDDRLHERSRLRRGEDGWVEEVLSP